jgi:hypothetical protein
MLTCVCVCVWCVRRALVVVKVVPKDYDGTSPAEVVLGPLIDQDRAEWMVPKEVACARRHRDFFKNDLYVTQQSIVKFLDVELRMPRKAQIGSRAKSFVFTAKLLRKRLDEEGYTTKGTKPGKEGKGKQDSTDAKNASGAAK